MNVRSDEEVWCACCGFHRGVVSVVDWFNHSPDQGLIVVNEIVCEKKRNTGETALQLAETLGTSADCWMRLESDYELNRARLARQLHESVREPTARSVRGSRDAQADPRLDKGPPNHRGISLTVSTSRVPTRTTRRVRHGRFRQPTAAGRQGPALLRSR